MQQFINILILMMMCSCASKNSTYKSIPEADAIVRHTNSQLASLGLFRCMHSGGCFVPLGGVALGYQTASYRFDKIDQARQFICYLFYDISSPLNNEIRIRPYLRKYPLTADGFYLTVDFLDGKGCSLESPYIASVSLSKGKISYESYDSSQPRGWQFSVLLEESFDEAEQLLKKQISSEISCDKKF